MKKFVKSFFMAAAALLLFAGCSNIVDDDVTVSGMSEMGEATLKISIEGRESAGNNESRMINPTAYTSSETFDKIVLSGVSETQEILKDGEGNEGLNLTTALNSGSAEVTLSASIWYLTLSAYKGTGANEKLVLQGRKRINLKSGYPSTPVTFSLSAEGLTTQGGVNLELKFASGVDTADVASAKAMLYDILTGLCIDSQNATFATGTKNFTYEKDGLNPGRYSFAVEYYNAEDTKIGVWGDIIAVAPGRTTSKTGDAALTVPDVLAKRPDAPTNFHAYRVNGSETDDGYYNVLFTWTRGDKKNEENFILTINQYADATAASSTVYKIFGTESDADNNKYDFFECADRVAGRLNATEESCIVRLPTGILFDATIQAYNFVGYSDYSSTDDGYQPTPRTEATDAASGNLPEGDAIPANTVFGAEKINRAKIVFNLNGGAYQVSGQAPVTGSVVKYASYSGTAATLASLFDASADNLLNGVRPFQGWLTATAGGVAITEYTYENLTVYANYNEVTLGIGYEIAVENWGTITAAASATVPGSSGTATWDNDSKTLTIDAPSNPDITFSVSDTGVTEIGYNIDNGEYGANGSGSSITFTKTNKLSAQKHTVVVAAKKADGKWYGEVIYVKIMR